jgi:FG-GAP-like repeat
MKFTFALAALFFLALCPALIAEVKFKKQTLTTEFVAEGCNVADFNRDGHMDVTAGCYIWYGPDFSKRVNFTPERVNAAGPAKTPYDRAKGYSDFFLAYTYDFDGDSWQDIMIYGFPGEPIVVYINPKNAEGPWKEHAIFSVADGESPDFKDINGDGKPDLLVHTSEANKGKQTGGQLGFAEINWSNPLAKARFRPITPKSAANDTKYFRYTHGYGAGDVNGDGRTDILAKEGWYEHPADMKTDKDWVFHPGPFGPAGARGGSFMYVYDVNADGRNDVITSYDAHGFGLGWFEQKVDGSFIDHKIMGSTPEENSQGVKFSQLHAMRLVDIDNDGLMDLVTGKRFWAHGPNADDEPNAPAELYWFQLKRDGADVKYVAHQIDNDSGVGTQVTTDDINFDKKTDVIVANKKGVFVFTQQ